MFGVVRERETEPGRHHPSKCSDGGGTRLDLEYTGRAALHNRMGRAGGHGVRFLEFMCHGFRIGRPSQWASETLGEAFGQRVRRWGDLGG